MPTIGIDVDLVVCDPVMGKAGWFDYLNNITGKYNKEQFLRDNQNIDYDLGLYFQELNKKEVMHYWSEGIYTYLEPYKGAIDIINELAQNNKIAFISFCKKGHFGSKVDCLKKWFNIPHEHWSFYATKQKAGVRVDCMIDDRNSNLNQFYGQDKVIKIKFDTPYSQCEELKISLDLCTDDWYSIGQFLEETL